MTLSEKLEKVMDKKIEEILEVVYDNAVNFTEKIADDRDKLHSVEKAKADILTLFRSLVPEEKTHTTMDLDMFTSTNVGIAMECIKSQSFNACRTAILSRIDSLKSTGEGKE
jgi:hypothetical protein